MTEVKEGSGTYTCEEYWCGFSSESHEEWSAHREAEH